MFFEFICPFIVYNLECCCQNQQKQEAAGLFEPSQAQSSAPTSEWTGESLGCLEPLLALHDKIPVPGVCLMVCYDSVHILELLSDDPIISGLNPMALAVEKSMVSLYVATPLLLAEVLIM